MYGNQAKLLEGQTNVQDGAEPLSQSAPDGFNQAIKIQLKSPKYITLDYINLWVCDV